MTEEHPPCRVCGSTEVSASYSATERMFALGGVFAYDECAGCESLNLRDVPEDLGRYYPSDRYYSYQSTTSGLSSIRGLALRAMLFWPHGRLLATLAPGRYRAVARVGLRPSCRVVDVGGGYGALVDQLRMAGLAGECIVVDPFAPADRTAGGSVIVRDDLACVRGSFDLVMFHHSLEHHAEPRRALEAARGLLCRRGAIVVRVPTVSSLCWRRYGVRWVELDAPRHLFVPSEAGITRLLEAVGFTVESSWRDGESFQLWGSELYRRDLPYAQTDPRRHFSKAELGWFERETRRLNRSGESGRLALISRKA